MSRSIHRVVLVSLVLLLLAPPADADGPRVPRWMQPHLDGPALAQAPATATPSPSRPSGGPLAGVRIALDPGHQLGNGHFPAETGRLVDAGGLRKACNTTGTASDAGLAESTVNFAISRLVRARLRDLGATVRMTRSTDSESRWGPCVDERARFPGRIGADLMVSVHADGSLAGGHRGFHVIVPTARSSYTADIAGPSLRLGRALRDALDARGVPRSTYVGDGTGLSVRGDLGTLNLSAVPTVMLELGNLRDPRDAGRLSGPAGQEEYAEAVVAGIRDFLQE